ncbi:unnamed protein product [Darwinula stevensoni]|uniref:Calreticulin n=1 Tax=Darwinula stevensoni TaxID=69355 RepID=A0A7R8X8U2_9CRUS|nr:unnamed protein product [Darwinula stevensoni]CAG0884847.1 unnamed protein product [Darwinula stevensoni]
MEACDAWESRWVQSEAKSDYGKFVLTAGKFYGCAKKDKGIQTSQDARFYAISSKFPEPFSNKDKNLVIQFTVKHEQGIDCGGGYLKVFDCSVNQKKLDGDSPYLVMFGPDICGPMTRKVHVIFSYKGKNLLTKKSISCMDDKYTHLYTLVVKPDNTYEVYVDAEKKESGELEGDWDFLPPKKIKDPEAKKPEDWDDRRTIDDPDDKKPDDWEKPEHIPDPDATKPEDWDDEMDGEWEPPMIDNPEYKGEWKPRQIDNPNYKGEWIHPMIDNPDYSPDSNLYLREEVCALGLDLWQVKSGTIFDNFLVSDDPEEALRVGKEMLEETKKGEKEMHDAQEEEEKKKRDAESKASKENENEDEDDEEEDEALDDDAADKHDEL